MKYLAVAIGNYSHDYDNTYLADTKEEAERELKQIMTRIFYEENEDYTNYYFDNQYKFYIFPVNIADQYEMDISYLIEMKNKYKNIAF